MFVEIKCNVPVLAKEMGVALQNIKKDLKDLEEEL